MITEQENLPNRNGTKEWTADDEGNAGNNEAIETGCECGCRYCFGCFMANRRTNQPTYRKNLDDWTNNITPQVKRFEKRVKHRKGIQFCFSVHNISLRNYSRCLKKIQDHLSVKNRVLIVIKPRLAVVNNLVEDLEGHQLSNLLEFRFTITSIYDFNTKFWEPNASLFDERLRCLQLAYSMGYKTSVAIEPYLDVDPTLLIKQIEPYCSSIWLGVMNKKTMPWESRQFYPPELYSQDHLAKIIPLCEQAAKGKLKLKITIWGKNHAKS